MASLKRFDISSISRKLSGINARISVDNCAPFPCLNLVEAQNSALRRKCSPYRRKTITYAKSETGLQRVLNVYWVIHNFCRVHFTTKKVPAVSIGIIEQGLSLN